MTVLGDMSDYLDSFSARDEPSAAADGDGEIEAIRERVIGMRHPVNSYEYAASVNSLRNDAISLLATVDALRAELARARSDAEGWKETAVKWMKAPSVHIGAAGQEGND